MKKELIITISIIITGLIGFIIDEIFNIKEPTVYWCLGASNLYVAVLVYSHND